MNVAIFGMGYVGCVSAACLANSGHRVVGVDVSEQKLALLAEGRSPIVEPGMDKLVPDAVGAGRLGVETDVERAVADADVSLVCVGTPSRRNGTLDLSYVETVCSQIGAALADAPGGHVIIIRSTMLPGSVAGTVVPAIQRASGRAHGDGWSVAINPEFLREGSAVHDYRHPPFTLIGADNESARQALRELYAEVDAPVIETGLAEAEMVKYSCNCFHGLKVAFANEIGAICKAAGIDSHVVMDAFCTDEKLNLSSYYLRPGFAFGGSCLPKDLRAIGHKAHELDVDIPVLAAVLRSNEARVQAAFERIEALGIRDIAMLGLSFKPGTDDLRESPMVTLAERLIGRGYRLRIHDREVDVARLVGANRSYIDAEIPHLSVLLKGSVEEALDGVSAIVVCKQDPGFRAPVQALAGDRPIVDLVRLKGIDESLPGYDGLGW